MPITAPFVDCLAGVIGDNLLGVYLHGSLALGCFNSRRSDVDLLAVTHRPMSPGVKRAVAAQLLVLSGQPYPVEISILAYEHLHPWRYPTPYDFHYSEDWREKMRVTLARDDPQDWAANLTGDADLAAHITVLHARGVCLLGASIAEVFPPVPRADFLASLRGDVLDERFGVSGAMPLPVYSILNACRTLAYLRTGQVLSKVEGGAWALTALPAAHRPVIGAALASYEQASVAEDAVNDTPDAIATGVYLREQLTRAFGEAAPGSEQGHE